MATPSWKRLASEGAAYLASVAAIGWLDAVSGTDLGLSLFYLLPVAAAGWRLGSGAASTLAVAAAGVWLGVELATHTDASPLATLWNGFTRLVIFGGNGVLLARLRAERETQRRLAAELRRSADAEAALARTDSLTGLLNRRAFEERLEAQLVRCRASGAPLCLAYVDLDHFKRVNDALGHEVGDEVLLRIHEALRDSGRAEDAAARLGGDEFALLLSASTAERARSVGERLLERLRLATAPWRELGLGASVGVAVFTRAPDHAEEAQRRADAALYQAKQAGRGRVVYWSDEAPAG